ncbi:hypothetical protein GCM10027168_38550 [Streptomyces capparidis]
MGALPSVAGGPAGRVEQARQAHHRPSHLERTPGAPGSRGGADRTHTALWRAAPVGARVPRAHRRGPRARPSAPEQLAPPHRGERRPPDGGSGAPARAPAGGAVGSAVCVRVGSLMPGGRARPRFAEAAPGCRAG